MFEKVHLKWGGEVYTVQPKRVMGLIACIEEHITLMQLSDPSKLQNTRIATAYAAAVNYAGGDAEPSAVYEAIFSDDENSISAVDIVGGIVSIMIPPSAKKEDAQEKKPKPEREAEQEAAPEPVKS